MFLEDDDLFGGSPRKKYFDIMFNANQNLVEHYMTKNLERIIALEHLLQEQLGEDVDIDKLVLSHTVNDLQFMEDRVINSYIADMGDILTQNE